MMRPVVIVALFVVASCADETPAYPDDCSGLQPIDALRCAEVRHWDALTHDYEARDATYALLSRVISEVPEGIDDALLGEIHFRRGALGIALAIEHGIDRTAQIIPDFEDAVRLAPDNPKFPPWLDSMELVVTFARGETTRFEEVSARLDEHVALYPVGNALSITGTMVGFPLSTGLPQRAVEMLERWVCSEDWCAANTARAPYGQPGIQFHFADAYARVGRVADARRHLEAALAAEGADTWPHRDHVESRLADVEGWVEEFAAAGDDGAVISLVYANTSRGCSLCHGAR